MRLQDYDTTTQYRATVLSSNQITPNSVDEVREIKLQIDDPSFEIHVGQNIGVLAPGYVEMGHAHHLRIYSIADLPQSTSLGHQQIKICVRRCSYIDEFTGEQYPGIASNYLCNLQPGDVITITGPYGQAFELPANNNAALILICAGTGIAPFRAFIKHIYTNHPDFKGRILLFHGGQTGLDQLYRNDENDDLAYYYDHATFEAIDALSARPGWSDQLDWGTALHAHGKELCELLSDSRTYVYVAGVEKIRDELDDVLAQVAGSNQIWFEWKSDLQAEGRWIELLY